MAAAWGRHGHWLVLTINSSFGIYQCFPDDFWTPQGSPLLQPWSEAAWHTCTEGHHDLVIESGVKLVPAGVWAFGSLAMKSLNSQEVLGGFNSCGGNLWRKVFFYCLLVS